jgi:hypothetical protein
MAITTTARSLITGVFQMLTIVSQGEEPTAPMLYAAFDRLNELVDAWELHRYTQAVTSRDEFALVAGQASYTIGPTALAPDWVAPRPMAVESVALVLPGTAGAPDTEVKLGPLTEEAYQAIQQKGIESSQPTTWRYELTMPLGTFTFWPVPNTADYPVAVYAPVALTQFATLSTSYTLAPGLMRALRYNLAREISLEYGRPLNPAIASVAIESLATFKHANVPMMDLALDPGLLGGSALRYGYNINTDQG